MIKAYCLTPCGELCAFGADAAEATALLAVGCRLAASRYPEVPVAAPEVRCVSAPRPGQVFLGDEILLDPAPAETPDLPRVRRLLERAASRLQDYAGEVDGDMNDALAMEIEAFLKTLS